MDSWYKVIDPNNPGPDHELMAGAYGYSLTSLARRYLRDAIKLDDPEAFQDSIAALEDQYHRGKGTRDSYSIPGPEINLVIPEEFLATVYDQTAYEQAKGRLKRAAIQHGDPSFLYTTFVVTGITATGRGKGKRRTFITGQFKNAPTDLIQQFDIPPSMVPPKNWTGIFNALDYSLSHGGE